MCLDFDPRGLRRSAQDSAGGLAFSDPVFLSRENSFEGEVIDTETGIFGAQRMILTDAVWKRLPASVPGVGTLGRCAVVGSSAILQRSSYGKEIAGYDNIFRINISPTDGFGDDVGDETDVFVMGLSASHNPAHLYSGSKWEGLKKRICGRAKFVVMFGVSQVEIDAFASTVDTVSCGRLFLLNPRFIAFWENYRNAMGHHSDWLSSGGVAVAVAANICESVDLYGFHGALFDNDGMLLPSHYYPCQFANCKEGSAYLPITRPGSSAIETGLWWDMAEVSTNLNIHV